MIYTIEKLRTYARGVDERLADVDVRPDAWVDERLEEAFAIATNLRPIFSTKEKYDLEANITVDLLDEVEIILQQEPQSVLDVEYDTNFWNIEITANNHIIMSVKASAPQPADYTVTVKYYFYPLMPLTTIELSVEMYLLLKPCIAAACYSMLSDEENEAKYLSKAKGIALEYGFDNEKNVLKIPVERLWSGTWA